MTSKERAELKAQAMNLDSIFQIGKSSLTPQLVDAVNNALKARELIKINVLKNCVDNPVEIAEIIAERTGSQVVQVIGKKIVLYKKNPKIEEKRQRAQMQKKKKKTIQKTKRKKEGTKEDSWQRKKEMMKKRNTH